MPASRGRSFLLAESGSAVKKMKRIAGVFKPISERQERRKETGQEGR